MNEINIDHLFEEEDSNDFDFEGFTDRDNDSVNAIQVQVHVVKEEILPNEDGSYPGGKLTSNVSCPLSGLIHLKNQPDQLKNVEIDLLKSSDGLNLCISNPRSVSAEFFENELETSFDSRKRRKIKPKLSGNDFVSNTDTLIKGMVSKTLGTYNNVSDSTLNSTSEYSTNKRMNRKSMSDSLNVSPLNSELFKEYSKPNPYSESSISKRRAEQNSCSSISNDENSISKSPNCRNLNSLLFSDSSSPFKGFENSHKVEFSMKPKKRKYNSTIRNLKKNKQQEFTSPYLSEVAFKDELQQPALHPKRPHYYDTYVHQAKYKKFLENLLKEKDMSEFEEFDLPHYLQMIDQSPHNRKFGPFKSVRKGSSYIKKDMKELNKFIEQQSGKSDVTLAETTPYLSNYSQDAASSMVNKKKKTNNKRGRKKSSVDDREFKPTTHLALATDGYPSSTLLSKKPSRKRKLISFEENDEGSDEDFLNVSKTSSINSTINSVLKKTLSPQKKNSATNEICSDDEDFLPAEVMHLERQLKREEQRVKLKMEELSTNKELNNNLRDYLFKAKVKLQLKHQIKIDRRLSVTTGDDLESQSLDISDNANVNSLKDASNKTIKLDKNPDKSPELFNASKSPPIEKIKTLRKFRLEKTPDITQLTSYESSPNLNEPSNENTNGDEQVATESLDSERLNNKTVIDKAQRFNSIFQVQRIISAEKKPPTPVHILCEQIDEYQRRRNRTNNGSVISKLLNKYRAINSNSNLSMLQSRLLNK